jgi:hypothetical protein
MTHITRLPAHATPSSRARRRALHTPQHNNRRPSVRLISDGVVASYIHDISQRHRNAHHAAEARADLTVVAGSQSGDGAA